MSCYTWTQRSSGIYSYGILSDEFNSLFKTYKHDADRKKPTNRNTNWCSFPRLAIKLSLLLRHKINVL